MVEALAIYRRLIGISIRGQMQYRFSFALRVIGSFFITLVDFIAIAVIFSHVPVLAGWRIEEVAFLYGTSYVGQRVGDLVVGNLDRLSELIRTGSFDTYLVRPVGSLLQVVAGDFALRQLGGALQGAVVLVVAVGRLEVDWTPVRAAMLPMMLVSGLAIYCGIWVATNTIVFWLIDSREVANAFTYGGNALTQYPLNIYGRWLQRLAIFVVPLAFVNYFPSLYILGKDDLLGAPSWARFASPFVAVATLAAGAGVWRFAVRHYRSTGS